MSDDTKFRPAAPYIRANEQGAPYLEGYRCSACEAVFLGARENCAACAARGNMKPVQLGTKGRLYNYTIVYRSFPGVTVPFVSAIVDLDGGGVIKGNLLDTPADIEHVRFGMPVDVVFRDASIANPEGKGFTSHFFVPSKELA